MKGIWLTLPLSVVLAAGCSGGGGGWSGKSVEVRGQVWLEGVGRDPADGVQIEAWVDADGDGRIGAGEKAQAMTGADGAFAVQAPAAEGKVTVLSFTREGCARQLRTIGPRIGAGVSLQVVLRQMEDLDCAGGVCRDVAGSATVSGAQIAKGRVRVFNPAVETDAFPGEFRDNSGKLLVSSVFGLFELYDDDNRPIGQLPSGGTARMEMRLPRDSWSTLRDIVPGTDRIDVPMYFFDEAAGQWQAEGTGWLVTAAGELLAETEMSSVNEGGFSGDLYAAAEVSHFSYWNVDWPQADNGSVGFQVVDESNQPVTDATCFVGGVNFSGTSSPLASGTGTECADLRRSEAAGEDLDGNGKTGEILKAQIVCMWRKKYYRFPAFNVAQASGSCPVAVHDAGVLVLGGESEVTPSLCSVSGVVMKDGSPLAGVAVVAEDASVPEEVANELCGGYCQSSAVSGADGSFSLRAALATGLDVTATATDSPEESIILLLGGKRRLLACDGEPILLHLEVSLCQAQLPSIQLEVGSGSIDWQPAEKAQVVAVVGGSSSAGKWQIYSEDGIMPPLVYGSVPAGAMQTIPPGGGAPPPLVSGDLISVLPLGGYISVAGHRCHSAGVYRVP